MKNRLQLVLLFGLVHYAEVSAGEKELNNEKLTISGESKLAPDNKTVGIDRRETRLQIGFGQNLSGIFNDVMSTTEWKITKDGQDVIQGTGENLRSFQFDSPGKYKIVAFTSHLKHSGECKHSDEEHIINLEVLPVRLEWKWDEDKWHTLFSNQKQYSGTQVEFPVTVFTYNKQTESIVGVLKLYLAGVGCNLTGYCNISEQAPFRNGETRDLIFSLTGNVEAGAYVQLDCTDPLGHTTSFQIQKPLR